MKRPFCHFALSTSLLLTGLTSGALEKYSWTLGHRPDKTIQYKTPEQGKPLKLDIFFPEGHDASKQAACVVFFFGGGWNGGSTDQFYGFGKYFASRGLVAISAQYRTKSSHKAIPRQCVEDGMAAIRYVREHAAELGIDPKRVIAGGGSAGGHVAAATAMCLKMDPTPKAKTSHVPNALLLFNPVYDNSPGGYGHERVQEYWEDISPMDNIREGLPPTIVFFGEKDGLVSVPKINAFDAKMEAVGNVCESHIYPGEKHGLFHIQKGGRKVFEDVLTKADAFLVKEGFLSGTDSVAPWTASSIAALKQNSEKKRK